MIDANGVEIKIGSRVRHKYPPCDPTKGCPAPAGQHHCCHNFAGEAPVIGFTGSVGVQVRSHWSNHIPTHLAEMLVVVE